MSELESTTENGVPKWVIWVVAGFLLLGLGFTAGAGWWIAHDIAKVRSADQTTGEVIERHEVSELDMDAPGRHRITYAITVRYPVDGVMHLYRPAGMNPAPQLGDRVTVYYQPDDPDDARLGGAGSWMGHGILLSIGLIALAVSLIAVYVLRKVSKQTAAERRENDSLVSGGRRVNGTVQSLAPEDGSGRWVLTVAYTDPVDDRERTATHTYDDVPDVAPAVGAIVPVAVDPTDPENRTVVMNA